PGPVSAGDLLHGSPGCPAGPPVLHGSVGCVRNKTGDALLIVALKCKSLNLTFALLFDSVVTTSGLCIRFPVGKPLAASRVTTSGLCIRFPVGRPLAASRASAGAAAARAMTTANGRVKRSAASDMADVLGFRTRDCGTARCAAARQHKV